MTDTDFDRFWAAYPRKIGKGAARVAWDKKKAVRPSIEVILTRLAVACLSNQWTKGVEHEFVPLPTTWINQERWDDDPLPIESIDPWLAKREATQEIHEAHRTGIFPDQDPTRRDVS